MAQSFFKYNDFISKIRTSNLPRSERFEVLITPPAGVANAEIMRDFTIMCEEAQIPGLSATNIPYRIGAWTEYRTTNVEFLSAEFVFTFVCNEDWGIRKVLEDWIFSNANPISKEVAWASDTYGSIEVASLDMQDNVVASWKLYNVVPKLVNLVPVSNTSPGIIRLSTSFVAEWWERVI